MHFFARLCCVAVVAVSPLLARSQASDENVNFKLNFELTKKRSYATLDDLSAALLWDPYVLVQIGVKKSQIVMVPFRDTVSHLFTAMMAAQVSSAETTEEGTTLAAEALKGFEAPSGVLLSDLTAGQRLKLQSVAMKQEAMHALLTKEVGFALRLTPDQQKRLKTIREEYWTRRSNIERKNTDNAKFMKLMKSFETKNSDDLSPTQKMALAKEAFENVSRFVGETAQKIEGPVAKVEKESNARALRVLTAPQTRLYRELQNH